MYCAFPVFVLFFSIKRVVNILLGKEDREVIEPVKEAFDEEKETAEAKE